MLPLSRAASASFGLVLLVLAHAVGWPVPRGGAQRIGDALASYLRSLGGEVVTGAPVESLRELDARAVICDVTPRELTRLAGAQLPSAYRERLWRYRYGPGAFKLDYALDGADSVEDTGVRPSCLRPSRRRARRDRGRRAGALGGASG